MDLEELIAKWEHSFNEIQRLEKIVSKEKSNIWKTVYEIEFDKSQLKAKAKELMEEENYGPKLAREKAKEELLDDVFVEKVRKNKSIQEANELIESHRAVFIANLHHGQLATVESIYQPAFDVAKALAETLKKVK